MGARLQMSSDWGRPVDEAVLAKLLNNGWSQEAAAAAADRLAATSPATTELEPERPAVPISEIPCTGFWLNEGELARWNRINTQLCWKWTEEDRAWYLSRTGRDIPQHLHVPKPHAPHECHLHAPEPQRCDYPAQPLVLATRPPPDVRHQAPATMRVTTRPPPYVRRESHESYWAYVRAAQEAAEEEAKEPPLPSQSSRDEQWKPRSSRVWLDGAPRPSLSLPYESGDSVVPAARAVCE